MSDLNESYYKKVYSIGKNYDFITSPEISQMFSEMIYIWFIDLWEKFNKPKIINFVEFGSGTGEFLRVFLYAAKKNIEFFNSIRIYIIDINIALIQSQKSKLFEYRSKINWINNISEIPQNNTFFFMNEFLDSLPIKQFIYKDYCWNEIIIKESNGSIVQSYMQIIDQNLLFRLSRYHNIRDGDIIEISLESENLIFDIVSYINKNKGAALIIDYGYDIDIKRDREYISTLQSMKSHKYCDIFSDPGNVDLTHHVDFEALRYKCPIISSSLHQRNFLMKCGIEIRLAQLIESNPELQDLLVKQYNKLVNHYEMGHLFRAVSIVYDSNIKPIGWL